MRVKIRSRLDEATVQDGTVEVDKERGLFTVRPKFGRGNRTWTLPIATVADIVVARCIKNDLANGRRAR